VRKIGHVEPDWPVTFAGFTGHVAHPDLVVTFARIGQLPVRLINGLPILECLSSNVADNL